MGLTLRDYDLAMEKRWQAFFPNSYFVNSNTHGLYEVRNRIIKENPSFNHDKDSIFPVFMIRRSGMPELVDPNWVANKHGLRFGEAETRVPFCKFKLTYQLDCVCSSRENFDEINIEVQENFLRFGFLSIDTNDPVWGTLDITLVLDDCEDTTDVESMEENTNLYRSSFTYSIDAVLSRKFRHLSAKNIALHFVDNRIVETIDCSGDDSPEIEEEKT